MALVDELTQTGEFIGGEALADPVNSKTVSVRDGAPVVTDGPYLEAKEYLAGYCIFECESLERAIEIAGTLAGRPLSGRRAAAADGRRRDGDVRTDARIEDLLRRLAPQVLGVLARRYRQFDACEDAVQEAPLAAAVQWPEQGVPESPRAWLVTVASRRMTDQLRSEQAPRRREDTAAALVPAHEGVAPPPGDDKPRDEDDTLTLLFMCCHPGLSPASQLALTLRAVGGLTTAQARTSRCSSAGRAFALRR